MSSDDNQVKIVTAKIQAWQAIVAAVITGVLGIVTTLITTGTIFSGRSENTGNSQKGSGSIEMPAPVLDAPIIRYRSKAIDFPLDRCMEKARAAFESGGFTGTESREYVVQGYRSQYTASIWCHTDVGQAIFIAAGKDGSMVEQTLTLLDRAY